jgi:hypothetical protein
MRARHGILLVATGVLLASVAGTALAQGAAPAQSTGPADIKTPITIAELFNKAKPGMWVRLEGTPQPDQTIHCTKARLISGNIDDNDCQIRGQIRAVAPAARQLTIGGHVVKIKDSPKLTPIETLHSINDLKVGMFVKVVGTYSPDGLLARKVDDQSADVAGKAGAEKKVLHQGKVERVDPVRKAIVLMGSTFVLTPDTKATAVVMM